MNESEFNRFPKASSKLVYIKPGIKMLSNVMQTKASKSMTKKENNGSGNNNGQS
jgi:hypothetical protein